MTMVDHCLKYRKANALLVMCFVIYQVNIQVFLNLDLTVTWYIEIVSKRQNFIDYSFDNFALIIIYQIKLSLFIHRIFRKTIMYKHFGMIYVSDSETHA